MKIDKAIEELKAYNSATFEVSFVTFSEALQLGIEALKRIRRLREDKRVSFVMFLPGETKE